MKKYLFIVLAAFGMAACAEKMDDNTPVHNGEVEESYIAISLTAPDIDTRTGVNPEEGKYQEGSAEERAVQTAYFFFFDVNGQPFSVNVTDNVASSPGGSVNYLQASLTGNGAEMDNVSDIKNVVLLLKNYVGNFPTQIVAVLNWIPGTKAYSLDELSTALASIRSTQTPELTGKFVMSNAVYATGATPSTAVVATPLTADNIKTTEAEAKDAPVTIHVERLAAKVTVTTTGGTTKFKLGDKDVYAQILGWELYNDYQDSYLLKHIDPSWSDTDLGFTWNDAPWYRCYWASTQDAEFPNNTFQWSYATIPTGYANENGYGFGTVYNVNNGTYGANTYAYCGENTRAATADPDPRTKIILKAQLVDEDNEAVELARWYATEYLGEEALCTAVANTLKYTLYYKEDENYSGIKPSDLQCTTPYNADGSLVSGAPSDIEAYEVFFQLSPSAQSNNWYLYNGTDYVAIGDLSSTNITETNAYLSANVEPAVLYKSGQTYYYIDIKHLGNSGKTGEYGIVRNHIYSINIESIGGYGSPIYFPTHNIVTPEYPEEEDEKSFVAAEVRILSWRLVSQGVDIQPNPEPTPGV